MAATVLMFILDERCSQHISKNRIRAPKAKLPARFLNRLGNTGVA
jgi:hypothetical protein